MFIEASSRRIDPFASGAQPSEGLTKAGSRIVFTPNANLLPDFGVPCLRIVRLEVVKHHPPLY